MRSSLPSLGTAFLLMISQSWAAEPNTLTDLEKSDGWRLLFDGKSPAGWAAIGKSEFPQKGWSNRDGLLEHQKGGGGGDIVTTEKFENFELTWEWKIGEAGNSGVKYKKIPYHCHERKIVKSLYHPTLLKSFYCRLQHQELTLKNTRPVASVPQQKLLGFHSEHFWSSKISKNELELIITFKLKYLVHKVAVTTRAK